MPVEKPRQQQMKPYAPRAADPHCVLAAVRRHRRHPPIGDLYFPALHLVRLGDVGTNPSRRADAADAVN